MNYAALSTEKANKTSRELDRLSPIQIVQLMNWEDRQVLWAISRSKSSVARAIRLIVDALRQGGRLLFVGAEGRRRRKRLHGLSSGEVCPTRRAFRR